LNNFDINFWKNNLKGELTDQDMKAPESQVFSYTAPWLIYALGFSNRKGCDYRIGIGSFL
jgi:hypothetical protein